MQLILGAAEKKLLAQALAKRAFIREPISLPCDYVNSS